MSSPRSKHAGEVVNGRPIPRATYRLQLTKDFPFAKAAALAPYLSQLGISHAYLSPVLKARRGSLHGYDIVDHTVLNPELGTDRDFEDMVAAFRAHEIGVVLDIVPNHMGIGGDENDLWLDVLTWGPKSRYADWFDINWSPSEPGLKNKLLVPMLGTSFGEALERGALELRHQARDDSYAIWAEGAHKLPICPETYHMIGDPSAIARFGAPEGRDALIKLISAQHWRPARYSVAADDINYRRFFIVSDLAAIRVEREEVFEPVHRLTLDLVREGLVDGLRVDHVDGLYDPKAYCLRLRERCPRPVYLVVEKILAPHETLRPDWQVEGTTGYEFASVATRLLTDPRGEETLTKTYEDFVGTTRQLAAEERNAKRNIIDYEMAAELDALTMRLRKLAASVPRTADLTRNAIRSALREVVAAMPVYRTYIDGGPLDDQDARNLTIAVARAREATPAIDPAVFDFLNRVLAGELCRTAPEYDPEDALDAARRVQQYTGPVMAKGLEDTALYRFNRLIALSDVGEKPDRFTSSVMAFHDFNRAQLRNTPHGMLTTSSHDTKRGEDTRARIAALSGYAQEWTAAVQEWSSLLETAGAPALERNDVYYFFQMLLGAWPTTLDPADSDGLETFCNRMEAAMLKSVREARMKTNWSVPRTQYEQDVSRLVRVALASEAFIEAFVRFEREVASAGAQNGLIETVLKLTVPGVPDIYQGAELWEQSMVDPDNRRRVDFEARKIALRGDADLRALVSTWRDGGIKQRCIAQILKLRKDVPTLFSEGSYEPLETGDGVCAFWRRRDSLALLVAVDLYPWRARSWCGERLELPDGVQWEQLSPITGLESVDGSLRSLFRDVPIHVAAVTA
jgi:(1->4)-alpha-D-glucan 1-alpha-D-glucosylmutase